MVDINGYEISKAFTGGEPVSAIYSFGEKVWPTGPEPITWGGLKFTALEAGYISMTHYGTNKTTTKPNLSYSKDGVNWTEWDYSPISVNESDFVYFKGINNGFSSSTRDNELDVNNYSTFYSNCKFAASGNIMSLLYGDYFEDKLSVGIYCFSKLFFLCSNLTSAPELPATELSFMCYSSMFSNCTSLNTAPELPATTLSNYCYYGMFGGCTSLTTVPSLPATKLADRCCQQMFDSCTSLVEVPSILSATKLAVGCYEDMFSHCTSLTTAPELPATKLELWCYDYMFRDCTNLNYVKANFTNIPSDNYTYNWLSGVSSTGTFVANPKATWTTTIERNESTVPAGWTITK